MSSTDLEDMVGKKYLITTDKWFFAPDGQQYRAVHGTVKAVLDDKAALGIATNSRSTNWYLSIGNMLIAGCQIYYAIQVDDFSREPQTHLFTNNENVHHKKDLGSSIYNADE